MPKYQCPDCHTVLRRAEAIPAGKKIRCPKCEAVFPAQAMAEEPEPAKESAAGYAVAAPAPPPPKPAPTYEDEDSNPYSVVKESGEEIKPEIHLGSLRDRFAKSTIGPAMFKTVVPSNWMLRGGLFTCAVATFFFIYGVFPVIFCEANPSRPFIRPRVEIMLKASLLFSFGTIMCMGAAKLHDLTSFAWSIIGPIMALPSGFLTGVLMWIFLAKLCYSLDMPLMYADLVMYVIIAAYAGIGVWCFVMAVIPDVRAGFKERAEELETV
jgi:hypothetical protein